MTASRRALLLGAPASLLAAPSLAQGRFPNRPIRFLIPWPPGGQLDALKRMMFEIMHRDLSQPLVIENMPGARGTRAATFLVQQARPDGYTLAHHHLSVLRHPFLTRTPTWDPVADFTPVCRITGFLFGTAVRADAPWRSWRDMIEAARARPGELTYSTSGIATSNHIAKEDILARERVRMEHIPMRGAQEGVTAVLGRQVHMMSDASSWRPQVEAGDMRLLAVWTPTRLPAMPDVPTLQDLGYGMSVTSPYGVVGPRGMDAEIVETLHQSFRKAYFDESVQAFLRRWDLPNEWQGPREYAAFIAERVVYEREMVRKLNLSID
jgi:tripartite-type tricarboxylate transporter receptor subunit TctC